MIDMWILTKIVLVAISIILVVLSTIDFIRMNKYYDEREKSLNENIERLVRKDNEKIRRCLRENNLKHKYRLDLSGAIVKIGDVATK